MNQDDNILLPGQPVTIPNGAAPDLGGGLYLKDGVIRASLVGKLSRVGNVSDLI